MENLSSRYDLTQNEKLRVVARMATIKAANDVLADTSKEQQFPFARFVIREPLNNYWLDQMMFSVVSNPVITEDATDNDIQFTVNSVFQKHALANTNL